MGRAGEESWSGVRGFSLMSERRPIQPDIVSGGRGPDASEVAAKRFRELFARWAATVTIVAARDAAGAVHATTVSSFAPLSAEPPLVVVCLGAGAQVLPWAGAGDRIGVSVLREDQSRWASVFTDALPVATPKWTEGAAPRIPGAVAALACTVREVHPTEGASRILVCHVDEIELGEDDRPLLYWQRGYRKLDLG